MFTSSDGCRFWHYQHRQFQFQATYNRMITLTRSETVRIQTKEKKWFFTTKKETNKGRELQAEEPVLYEQSYRMSFFLLTKLFCVELSCVEFSVFTLC